MKSMRIKKIILAWVMVMMVGITMLSPLWTMTVRADETDGQSADSGEMADSEESDPEDNESLLNGRFLLHINYGFDGQFRMGAAIPVTVSLTAVKEDFEGTVSVIVPGNTDYSTAPVSYEREVSLKEGVKKNVTLSIYDLSYITGFELQLRDSKDNICIDKKYQVSSNTGTSALTGVLCDDYDALSYMDHCDINVGDYLDGSALVELNQASFPEQKSGLEALSYLVIDNYSSSQLTEQQLEAIKGWVSSGGVLILGAGENGPRTLSAFQEDLLEYTQGQNLEGELQLKSDEQYINSASEEEVTEEGSNVTEESSVSTADGDAVTTADGDAVSAAEGDAVTIAGGDAVTTADGDAVSTAEGDAITTAGGDAVTTTDGDAVTTADGDDTQSDSLNSVTEENTENTEDTAALGGDAVTEEQEETSYIKIDKKPYQYTKKDGVLKLTVKEAEPLEGIFQDDSLIWNKDYGKGHVIITAFDLSSELIGKWNAKEDFATVLFSEAAFGYSAERIKDLNYYNYSDHHEEATALYHMISIGTPDMKQLAIILGVFVLLIGLGYYIFLRIIDKRGFLWILIPLTCVVCCGVIFYVTKDVRINHPVTASMTEIYYDSEQDSSETTVDLLTVVPGTKASRMKLEESLYGPKIYNLSDSSSLIPSYEMMDTESYDANAAVSENADGCEVTIDNDRTFASTFLRLESDEEMEERGLLLEAERTLEGISGTVTNNSGHDMKCVSVYVRGNEVAIGDLKAGESMAFTNAENKELDAEFQQLGMPGISMGTTEYDQIERAWDIFYSRYLSDMDAMDVYTFGYISDIEKNYIEDDKIQENNTGMIICRDSIGYKEFDGYELYDLYEYLGEHDNGFTDDGSQVLGSTKTKCTFILPVKNISYMIRSDITQAGADSEKTVVYAYNVQTGKYDELFTDGVRMKFKENCPYVAEDGTLMLKFVCTEPGFECAPDLTVVGGED